MIKLLVVGTLPPPIGGTSISFQDFVRMSKLNSSVCLKVINCSHLRLNKSFISFCKFLITLYSNTKKCDFIMLHLSYKALALVSPFAILYCKLLKKKLIVRRFGGVLHSEMGFLIRFILNFTLKNSLFYLVETERQVAELKNANVYFYPTGRSKSLLKEYYSPPKKLKKIAFISQVKYTKGIFELIESVGINKDLFLEIYGPLYDSIKIKDLEKFDNVKYCGTVSGTDVNKVISCNDVICLPSYYSGEGYPGIVFEAIQCGKPVLLSNWKSLPDLIKNNSGVIVDAKSSESISKGLEKLKILIDNQTFIEDIEFLSEKFDSDKIFNEFINNLYNIL